MSRMEIKIKAAEYRRVRDLFNDKEKEIYVLVKPGKGIPPVCFSATFVRKIGTKQWHLASEGAKFPDEFNKLNFKKRAQFTGRELVKVTERTIKL